MAEPDLSILKSVILRLKMEIYGSTKYNLRKTQMTKKELGFFKQWEVGKM